MKKRTIGLNDRTFQIAAILNLFVSVGVVGIFIIIVPAFNSYLFRVIIGGSFCIGSLHHFYNVVSEISGSRRRATPVIYSIRDDVREWRNKK